MRRRESQFARRRRHTSTVFAVSSGLLAALLGACGDVVRVTSQSSNDASVDGGRAAIGAAEVVKKGCVDCHQGDLAGSPIPRLGTNAYPANLTPDIDTGLGSWTDDQVVRAMQDGIDKNDVPLCFAMPRFKALDLELAYDIVIYLRTLPPVHRVIPVSTCPPLKPPPDAGGDASGDAANDFDAAESDAALDGDATD